MTKIVQIAVAGVNNAERMQCDLMLYALCDDGTLWEFHDAVDCLWLRIPPPPNVTEQQEKTT